MPPPKLVRIKCEYGACYSKEDAARLAGWAAAMKRWAEDAWDLCGPNSGVK